MDSQRARIAQLQQWRGAWIECAAWVRLRAEERSIAWQERHIPERFQDAMPQELPESLWDRYHRQEIKYGDRLARSEAHARKADACTVAIRRLREQREAETPKQATLF